MISMFTRYINGNTQLQNERNYTQPMSNFNEQNSAILKEINAEFTLDKKKLLE